MKVISMRMRVALALGLGLWLLARARGEERVTLANGFAMSCTHHAVVDGRMRLYTGMDESSYIELAPAEVASFEVVPDTKVDVEPAVSAGKIVTGGGGDLHSVLATAGRAHNLDVELLASVVKAESGGNARARSRVGAQGLMQLMPKTASELGVKDSYAPEENVRGGATYLDSLLTRYHENLELALAAYNAGPAAVDRYHGIPPFHETRAYVARVIREFNRRVMEREKAERAGLR